MRAMFRPAWDRLVLPYWWYGVAIKIPIIKRGNKQHQHLLRKKKARSVPYYEPMNYETYEELQKTYKQVWKKEVRKVLLLMKSTVHFIKQVSVPSLKFMTPKKRHDLRTNITWSCSSSSPPVLQERAGEL